MYYYNKKNYRKNSWLCLTNKKKYTHITKKNDKEYVVVAHTEKDNGIVFPCNYGDFRNPNAEMDIENKEENNGKDYHDDNCFSLHTIIITISLLFQIKI